MASEAEILNRYKLDTVFYHDAVVHITYRSDQLDGWRRVDARVRWENDGELGAGAFGVVSRQRQTETGKLRAVKIIPKRQMNIREVEAMVELQDHPDLFVFFLGWFEDPHAIHIAMEYIEHGDLCNYIKADKEKAMLEAADITSQILAGLVVLHERDICHRDLKPQNILIACPAPIWVKISDFGIAKRSTGTSLRTGCGTVWYQSPEQLGLLPKEMRTKTSYTNAVDLWALGTVIHEILTSTIPFLDTYQEIDSAFSPSELGTAGMFDMDMDLLQNYCRGDHPFPCQSLEETGVNEVAIDLVKSLMVVNPKDRVSAAAALKSPWFIGLKASIIDPTETSQSVIKPRTRSRPETGYKLLRSQFDLIGISLSAGSANQLFLEEDRAKITDILASHGVDDVWVPIRKAIPAGYLEVVKVLLKLIDGVDGNKDNTNFTLLGFAAWGGQLVMMQLLFDHGAKANEQKWNHNVHDLTWRLADGTFSALNDLVNKSVHFTGGLVIRYGWSAMRAAARNGYVSAMSMLHEHGASINSDWPGMHGRSPLQAAAEGEHLEAIIWLFNHGAEINGDSGNGYGLTALQAAAWSGNLEIVQWLCGKGAKINARACELGGRTALQAAAENGHLEVIKWLYDNGAKNGDLPGKMYGRTALQVAAEYGHLHVVQWLLDNKKANVNARASEMSGRTALQAAAENGHLDTMKLLLVKGANINAEVAELLGRTAMQGAAEGGYTDAVRWLFENGAMVNAAPSTSSGRTAFQAAASGGHVGTMMVLLDMGVDINAAAALINGRTALQAAAEGGHIEAVRWLLEKRVHVNEAISDKGGLSALQAAAAMGNIGLLELLLDSGAEIDDITNSSARSNPLVEAALRKPRSSRV